MKILKFSSATCMPCKQLAKIIDGLDHEAKSLFIVTGKQIGRAHV